MEGFKEYIGTIELDSKEYSAILKSDLSSMFKLHILDIIEDIHLPRKYEYIFGIFNGLGEIQLIFGVISNSSISAINSITVTFRYMIKSNSYINYQDIYANKVNFQSEILKKVFRVSNIDFDLNNYALQLKEKKICLVNEIYLKISLYNMRNIKIERFEAKMKEDLYMSIEFIEGPKKIFEILDFLKKFKNLFFLFGFVDDTLSDEITFILDDGNENNKFEFYGWNYKKVRNLVDYMKSYDFDFMQIFNSKITVNWFKNELYHKVIGNLFYKDFNTFIENENTFFGAISSLEFYHKKIFKGNYSLRKRLEYFNFKYVLPNHIEIDEFFKHVVRSRNAIAHSDYDNISFTNLELLYTSVYIEAVIIYDIISSFDLDEDLIKELFCCTSEKIDGLYSLNKQLKFEYSNKLKKQ